MDGEWVEVFEIKIAVFLDDTSLWSVQHIVRGKSRTNLIHSSVGSKVGSESDSDGEEEGLGSPIRISSCMI
jgi:hypothetical protein